MNNNNFNNNGNKQKNNQNHPQKNRRWKNSSYDVIGGRRFIMCIGAGLITSLLTYYGKIDSSTYGDVVIWVTGLYITGNTLQKTGTPRIPNFMNRIENRAENQNDK